MTAEIKWEYEDELDVDITEGMFRASIVDIVRLYPYIEINDERFYLEVI